VPRVSSASLSLPVSILTPLYIVVAAALLAGLYGRFVGLGLWPLGVDEFYISRSIDNILRTGLPGFSCGGYYNRGILYQYWVAGVRTLGLTPELAGRLVAAVCSLAVLPAAYLLGRRMHSSLAGCLAVIILSVSIWEVEMARFARMYAPFQAVFAWYLICYLRYIVEPRRSAFVWMVALSVIGVLTWEGGVLLAVGNLLAVVLARGNERLQSADWKRLMGLVVLLALLYVIGTNDFRGHVEADVPAGASGAVAEHGPQLVAGWWAALRAHIVWVCAWLALCAFACVSLRWIRSFAPRWLAAAGLGVALLAAALHLFSITLGALALLLVSGLIDWREFTERRARYFAPALAAFFLLWLAFEYSTAGAGARSIEVLFGFPDVYDAVIRPWGRTLPLLSVALALALGYLFLRTVLTRAAGATPIAVLLSLLIVIVLMVGAKPAERIETRYTFFLYPLLIVLAVSAALLLLERLRVLRRMPASISAAFCAAVPLLCFGATEDFQPRHLAAVDSAAVNYRAGMSAVLAAHYYPRNDMRTVGEWLAAHVAAGDVVITGIPNLDEYYDRFDYFYLDSEDSRYEAYVCRDGQTDRWTNHPLLFPEDRLKPIVGAGHRVFASVYPDTERHLRALAQSEGWSIERVWQSNYGDNDLLLIAARARAHQ
jgi:hypothetical protein